MNDCRRPYALILLAPTDNDRHTFQMAVRTRRHAHQLLSDEVEDLKARRFANGDRVPEQLIQVIEVAHDGTMTGSVFSPRRARFINGEGVEEFAVHRNISLV